MYTNFKKGVSIYDWEKCNKIVIELKDVVKGWKDGGKGLVIELAFIGQNYLVTCLLALQKDV